jgi:hypothetical protein
MVSGGRLFSWSLVGCLVAGGCSSAGGQLGTLKTQNRSLLEQNRVQLAEIENLKTHSRRLEDKLIDSERQMAALDRDQAGDRKRPDSQDEETASSLFDKPANR